MADEIEMYIRYETALAYLELFLSTAIFEFELI